MRSGEAWGSSLVPFALTCTGNVLCLVADSVLVQPARCAEHCFGVDWHQLNVCQGDFGENLGFLELQRHSTKPWNLMWQFSDCQRVGLGVEHLLLSQRFSEH